MVKINVLYLEDSGLLMKGFDAKKAKTKLKGVITTLKAKYGLRNDTISSEIDMDGAGSLNIYCHWSMLPEVFNAIRETEPYSIKVEWTNKN